MSQNTMESLNLFKSFADASPYYEETGSYDEVNGDVTASSGSPIHLVEEQTLESISPDMFYDMTEQKLLIIFNHYQYKMTWRSKPVPSPREGTYHDVRNLEDTFRKLGFIVITHDDWIHRDIMKYLADVCKKDHNLTSCLVIAILTHGAGGHVCAADRLYPVTEVTDMLQKSTSLYEKPKLFFIQACRAGHTDARSRVLDIPEAIDPDFLVLCSSYEAYHVSYRDINHGTWMIRSLCDVINNQHKSMDLIQLVTFVSQMVQYKTTNGHKQMPVTALKLRKLLKF